MSISSACEAGRDLAAGLHGDGAEALAQIERTLSLRADGFAPGNEPLNILVPILYGLLATSLPDMDETRDAASEAQQVGSTAWAVERLKAIFGEREEEEADRIVAATKSRLKGMFSGEYTVSEHAAGSAVSITKRFKAIQLVARVANALVAPAVGKMGVTSPFDTEASTTQSRDHADDAAAAVVDSARRATHQAGGIGAFVGFLACESGDVVGAGLAAVLCHAHNRAWNAEDPLAASQVRAIAFATQFFAEASLGAVRTGVPHINWPVLVATVREMYTLVRASYAEIATLEATTASLMADCARIRANVERTGRELPSHANSQGLVAEFEAVEQRLDDLALFFEKI